MGGDKNLFGEQVDPEVDRPFIVFLVRNLSDNSESGQPHRIDELDAGHYLALQRELGERVVQDFGVMTREALTETLFQSGYREGGRTRVYVQKTKPYLHQDQRQPALFAD